MIQFSISSDPLGSQVVPEVEDPEIDSKKTAAGLTASDWPKGTAIQVIKRFIALPIGIYQLLLFGTLRCTSISSF